MPSELSVTARVVLGTVQFGIPYGRRRTQSLMETRQAFSVLDRAWELGIRAFDTAELYGQAPERLSRWLELRRRWDEALVVTKVSPDRGLPEVLTAIRRFARAAQVIFLTHGHPTRRWWESTARGLAGGRAELGQSLYERAELQAALHWDPLPARIQAPAHVLDMGIVEERGPAEVPLDLRSVFLQGILLESPELANGRAPGTGVLAAAIRSAVRATGSSERELPALLARALLDRTRPSDRIVVGADSPEHLDWVADLSAVDAELVHRFLVNLSECVPKTVDSGALDPRRWPVHPKPTTPLEQRTPCPE